MVEATRLYRSDDEVVSGVCAGVAERLDIDPAAARILAVLLTVCTMGLAAIVYVVMWLVLPKRMEVPAPISCAVYVPAEQPAAGRPRGRRDRGAAPVPPAGFVVDGGECRPAPTVAPVVPVEEPCEKCGMAGWSRLCVWIGSAILAVDVVLLFDFLIDGVVWWDLWPLACVVAGLVLMFVPSKKGSYIRRFSGGLALVSAGSVMLLMSVGVLSSASVAYAVSKLWPIFLVIAGLIVMNVSLHDQMFDFGMALCVVVVCVATCTAFAIPGPVEYVTVHMPFGMRVLDINPWI
ncbi:MAG: PspC domain-containing protein [Slackia sp.]|nr:PspC domain-containing protein [Slackia sp.]